MRSRARSESGRPSALALFIALALALIASPGIFAQEAPSPDATPAGTAAGPAAAAAEAAAARPAVVLAAPESSRPGDLVVAWAACAEPQPSEAKALLKDAAGNVVASAPLFDAGELVLAGAAWPRVYGVLMALPTDLGPGRYALEACGAGVSLSVDERSFVSERIPLDAKNSALRTRQDKKKEAEALKLVELLSRADPLALYLDESALLRPLAEDARRSSLFGDKRVYAYSTGGAETGVHAGYDYAVVEGTPVLACARGRAAMAADRIVTGKTLVLEHLPGLYSVYMHLSAIEVAEGAIAERGSRVALSGSTGLSTGPHLHWELRANGAAIDPEPFLDSPILDKALIINTIRALIEGR